VNWKKKNNPTQNETLTDYLFSLLNSIYSIQLHPSFYYNQLYHYFSIGTTGYFILAIGFFLGYAVNNSSDKIFQTYENLPYKRLLDEVQAQQLTLIRNLQETQRENMAIIKEFKSDQKKMFDEIRSYMSLEKDSTAPNAFVNNIRSLFQGSALTSSLYQPLFTSLSNKIENNQKDSKAENQNTAPEQKINSNVQTTSTNSAQTDSEKSKIDEK